MTRFFDWVHIDRINELERLLVFLRANFQGQYELIIPETKRTQSLKRSTKVEARIFSAMTNRH